MKIVIAGAGRFGREVLSLIRNINQVKQSFEVLGFVDDGVSVGTAVHDYQVLGGIDEIEAIGPDGVVIGIGNPKLRQEVAERIPAGVARPNIIHPLAIFQDAERINIGEGTIICAGNIFTTDISLGDFCVVNLGCTIGHDVIMGDYCSIMPGVNISGGARLQNGVYVGTGAKLIKATVLGAYSTVGAGAVVDADIAPNETVVGVPARPIKSKA